jgi:hypothetical protein
MKKPLTIAAMAELATGLALLIAPSLVGQLLLGAELTGISKVVARVTGIALIGLAVACWPGTPLIGMLTYSTLVMLYLAYVGVTGPVGILLWPAVAVHGGLSILLAGVWRKRRHLQLDRNSQTQRR